MRIFVHEWGNRACSDLHVSPMAKANPNSEARTGRKWSGQAISHEHGTHDCEQGRQALKVVAQFGRVVVRRGYGNHTTLANKRSQPRLLRYHAQDTELHRYMGLYTVSFPSTEAP
jgi:hypothetical protein